MHIRLNLIGALRRTPRPGGLTDMRTNTRARRDPWAISYSSAVQDNVVQVINSLAANHINYKSKVVGPSVARTVSPPTQRNDPGASHQFGRCGFKSSLWWFPLRQLVGRSASGTCGPGLPRGTAQFFSNQNPGTFLSMALNTKLSWRTPVWQLSQPI